MDSDLKRSGAGDQYHNNWGLHGSDDRADNHAEHDCHHDHIDHDGRHKCAWEHIDRDEHDLRGSNDHHRFDQFGIDDDRCDLRDVQCATNLVYGYLYLYLRGAE